MCDTGPKLLLNCTVLFLSSQELNFYERLLLEGFSSLSLFHQLRMKCFVARLTQLFGPAVLVALIPKRLIVSLDVSPSSCFVLVRAVYICLTTVVGAE